MAIGSFARWRIVESAMLAYMVAWEILLAATMTYRGGHLLSNWTFASHGLRIGVPLGLLLSTIEWDRKFAERVLIISTSATFFVHGMKAWLGSPTFITMIIATSQNLLGYDFPQPTVTGILKIIGAMDIILAFLLLSVRSRYLVAWMACWGLITAFARTMGASWSAYPGTLLRLVHLGGPLVLFLEWSRNAKNPTSEPGIRAATITSCE